MINKNTDYYYIDATWGDLVLDDEEIINNNYLMFDSQTMKKMINILILKKKGCILIYIN